MPVLPNREQIEARIARELGKVNVRTRRELVGLLGDPPKIENITDEAWQTIAYDYTTTLTPELEKAFIDAVANMAEQAQFSGVSFDLINEEAAAWARGYATDLTNGLIDSRKRHLGNAVADYYENKLDYRGMVDRVSRMYGTAKGEEIAITEVTRAAVEGERMVIDELTNQGVMLRKYWITVRDRRVCPICEPLDQVKADGIGFNAYFTNPATGQRYQNPPAHTRCRCGVGYDYENVIRP